MDKSVYNTLSNVADQHWWRRGKLAILHNVLSGLNIPENAHILEAGCGIGGYLPLLAQFGTVKAFEPSEFATPHLANFKSIAEIETGSLPDDIPFTEDSFDLIAAFDVLEHVKDDQAALCNMRKRLRPDGLLLLTVPAYQWLWTRNADELQHHFRRYSRKGLNKVCDSANLEVISSSYFNTFLFPLAAMARLIDKMTDRGLSQIGDHLPVYNEIFKKVFSSEKLLIPSPGFPFGLSILTLAKRKKN
jgi:SAM-dependent methyltransferase